MNLYAATADRLYVATDNDAYRLRVFDNEGNITTIIERDFDCRKRTPEEMERVRTMYENRTRTVPGARVEIEDHPPVIVALRTADDGSVWVLHNASTVDQPEGIVETFDVFTPDGTYDHELAIACPADGTTDNVFFLNDLEAVIITSLIDARRTQLGARSSEEDTDYTEESAAMQVIYCVADR